MLKKISYITENEAKNCFGARLRRGRSQKGNMSQLKLAEKIHKSRVMIANYENGRASPEPNMAIKLAAYLDEDPLEYLLLADLQRAFCQDGHIEKSLLKEINLVLKRSNDKVAQKKCAMKTHLTLMDFPDEFSPAVVIVGDKREEEPQNVGDLFAFTASTVDDRWLMSLGLNSNTEKISDKVVMTALRDRDEEWLKKRFGKKNIICIGSPASNLYARIYNDNFLFRFAIGREAHAKWKKAREDMDRLDTKAKLLQFQEQHRADLRQEMRLFKSPGFVDFNYKHLRLGMDISSEKDFSVVSLGRNPFAEQGAPFFAIMAAGVHHPGTAHAVKCLADTSNFERHPFGGVLEVEVPSKNVDPHEISWYNKIEKSTAHWHTVGGKELEYTPESLLEKLRKWEDRIRKGRVVTDIELSTSEIESHIRLIERTKTGIEVPDPKK